MVEYSGYVSETRGHNAGYGTEVACLRRFGSKDAAVEEAKRLVNNGNTVIIREIEVKSVMEVEMVKGHYTKDGWVDDSIYVKDI
jgi:hypothetical protein